MSFITLLESESDELNELHENLTQRKRNFIMESVKEFEDPELMTTLIEGLEHAADKITEKEVEEIKNTFDDTKVQLMVDKKGNRSFAVKNKNKVVYVTATNQDGSSGKELVMNLNEWNSFEKQLYESGISPVKEKSRIRDFMGFILKTTKWLSYAAIAIVVTGALVIAVSTGMAYTAQYGAALAGLATRWTPFKGTHVDMLWSLTSGKAAEVVGPWIGGMGKEIASALVNTARVLTGKNNAWYEF